MDHGPQGSRHSLCHVTPGYLPAQREAVFPALLILDLVITIGFSQEDASGHDGSRDMKCACLVWAELLLSSSLFSTSEDPLQGLPLSSGPFSVALPLLGSNILLASLEIVKTLHCCWTLCASPSFINFSNPTTPLQHKKTFY